MPFVAAEQQQRLQGLPWEPPMLFIERPVPTTQHPVSIRPYTGNLAAFLTAIVDSAPATGNAVGMASLCAIFNAAPAATNSMGRCAISAILNPVETQVEAEAATSTTPSATKRSRSSIDASNDDDDASSSKNVKVEESEETDWNSIPQYEGSPPSAPRSPPVRARRFFDEVGDVNDDWESRLIEEYSGSDVVSNDDGATVFSYVSGDDGTSSEDADEYEERRSEDILGRLEWRRVGDIPGHGRWYPPTAAAPWTPGLFAMAWK